MAQTDDDGDCKIERVLTKYKVELSMDTKCNLQEQTDTHTEYHQPQQHKQSLIARQMVKLVVKGSSAEAYGSGEDGKGDVI